MAAIGIMDPAVKNFVFAMFRPGLRQAFQFDIRNHFVQPRFFAGPDDGGILKIRLKGEHLFQVQRQKLIAADFQQVIIGEVCQIDPRHLRFVFSDHLRNMRGHTGAKIKIGGGNHLVTFNQIVCQKSGGNGFGPRSG